MENKVKFEVSTWTILKIIIAILAVWFFYTIREVVVLFFIVLVIVAALGPLVDRMAKYVPRILALIFISIVFLGGLTAIGFLIIPPIVTQIGQLAINAPYYIDKIGPFYTTVKNTVPNYQENLLNLSSQFGQVGSGIFSTTIGLIGGIVAAGTVLVLSFYVLLEQNSLRQFLHQTIPIEHKEKFFDVIRKIGSKMGSWLRGQVVLMIIIGLADGIALFFLGIPFALTLAVWGGLVEVVPYIGPWLGLIPALIIALTISPWKGLFVLIAYLLIQQLEGQFLVPKIMGKAVGLSPVIIILALLSGAKIMGILGMFVAVPIAAALSVIIQEWPELKRTIRGS